MCVCRSLNNKSLFQFTLCPIPCPAIEKISYQRYCPAAITPVSSGCGKRLFLFE